MHVDALLCDAATIREGLLHVLGAGVTRIHRPNFPAPLDLRLAIMLTLQRSEASERHRLKVILQDQDGQVGAQLDGEFGVTMKPGTKPGEALAIPMVLDLGGVLIPKAGVYSFELLVDSQQMRALPFTAVVAAMPLPGQPPPRP